MNFSKKVFFPTVVFCFVISFAAISQQAFGPEDLLSIKSVSNIQLSPDGSEIIYSLSTPRGPNEEAGAAHTRYYRFNIAAATSIALFEAGIKVSGLQWHPEGNMICFLQKAENESKQIWLMKKSGELKQITFLSNDVKSFKWSPAGDGLAYLSTTAKTAKEKELKKRAYDFIFYEENLKNTNLFYMSLNADLSTSKPLQLTQGENVWDFEFNRQGSHLAASISPKNLIDQKYMFRKIYMLSINGKTKKQVSENEGKLGNYVFSPDGKHLAYTASLNINDHAISQLFVNTLEDNGIRNLTPANFKGHIEWGNWKNNKELFYYSGEGVYPKLNVVNLKNKKHKVILDSEKAGFVFQKPQFTKDLKHFVFEASTITDPENIYYWNGKDEAQKITDINPQLKGKTLAKQELISYKARDGVTLEGLLMYPPDYNNSTKYPLIVYVHGGPESHHNNAWLSSYSTPGQVMANKGYLVVYLNYRASTGYGVDFAMEGFMDAAGTEFDDIADAMEYLIKEKGADRERIGMAGGSYGGYASAWFATYYTQYVKAVCMFVGISDVISKRGTTDIPYEELYVHSGKKLEEQWEINLKQSPIYWAHQSKTATLIYGGADDPRVHPSQSIELYRRMKMNDHPAVRLVQYPGEKHGNRKQVGRIDVLYRQIEWLDWYVKDMNSLDGPMPRLDISERYGLDWE